MRYVVLLRLSLIAVCVHTATGSGIESVAVRAFGFADVTDAGTIKAAGTLDYGSLTPVVCEVAEGGTVLSLVPEGTVVSRNQVLARLDSGNRRARLQSQTIAVAKAKAEWEIARQQLVIHDVQFSRKVAAADLDQNLARLDREKYLQAEFPGRRTELLSAVELEKRRTKQADERMQASLRLADKGLLSRSFLDADRTAADRARLNLELSRDRLKVLQELTHPRKQLKFDSILQQAQSQFQGLQQMERTIREQLESAVVAEELACQSARSEQQELQRQIELCAMRAPRDGVAVYPRDPLPAHENEAPAQHDIGPGSRVTGREVVIFLADLNVLNVTIELNESQARCVQPRQPAHIRFAELPGTYLGKVDVVRERRVQHADGLVRTRYFALVPVANPFRRLRPAMAARVEIDVGPGAANGPRRSVQGASQFKTTRVTSGPMVGTISECAEVESASAIAIPSQVDGAVAIRSILPQGTPVTVAQKVGELDSTRLREQANRQKVLVTRAKTDHTHARQRLPLLEKQNASAIAQAEIALKVSRLQRDEFTQGTYPRHRSAVLGEISMHRADLKQARQRLTWSERVIEKGYITKSTLEADRLSVEEREGMLKRSQQKLHTLEQYTFKRQMAELEARITESERELARTKREALARLAQHRSELEAKELTFTVEQATLARIDEQIAECILRAPCEGKVVYDTLADNSGRQPTVVREGVIVRKGQDVVAVARTGDVQANVRLSAAQVNRVQSGQQAVISPIAQPDREFRGKVEKISGTLDDRSQDQRSRHVTVVLSDEQQEAIRSLTPGLMAVVEVQVPMTGVLRVPTDAVVQENAESFCYVRTPQGVRKQKVVPGLGNDEVIEVKDGLNEGDLVVRNPWTVGGPEAGGE